ncbi:MAG: signal peptide peptidase SppA [Planctomycetales bacterium]|nr:signal peptide peptidase SppA [Planctomycetales bacterium]
MEFDPTTNTHGESCQPQPSSTVPPQTPPVCNIPDFTNMIYEPAPKKKGSGWKVFWGIVITLSLLANGFMLLAMLGMGAALVGGGMSDSDNGILEKTLVEGARTKKIAVISIEGIIEGRMSDWVRRQLKAAEEDNAVKGLIVRIASPGGEVSSSDQIHYYISRFKDHTQKPVLAFMQSIAASGGYYSAVACDQIMAEPTVITGSIGVIMNHLVIKGLLEEKLGISPVTIKSGPRKDWPSMFSETTEEEKQYLAEKIITPAYDRFVDLVAKGRKDVLSKEAIRQLADGSIYTAPEALEKKLIDQIGYFDDAVYKAEQMAHISNAHVVTYEEVFSVWSILGAESKSRISLESKILEKLAAPRILYLWDGKN